MEWIGFILKGKIDKPNHIKGEYLPEITEREHNNNIDKMLDYMEELGVWMEFVTSLQMRIIKRKALTDKQYWLLNKRYTMVKDIGSYLPHGCRGTYNGWFDTDICE